MTDNKPLWEVMHESAASHARNNCPSTFAQQEAARLRAIADSVVPDEPKPLPPRGMMPGGTGMYYSQHLARYEERMAIRQLLLDEADLDKVLRREVAG